MWKNQINLDGDTVVDEPWTQVRIRQCQPAVALRDVIRNGLKFSLHLLHQPMVGAVCEDGLPVVTQRNLQGKTQSFPQNTTTNNTVKSGLCWCHLALLPLCLHLLMVLSSLQHCITN